MSDESLRELYARALATRDATERSACPAPEAMLALIRREGSEEQRLALLDHVMACSACAREFELLRAIEQAGAKAVRADEGRVVGRIRWRRWAPLAAAAVLVVFALGPGRDLWRPRPDVVRGGGETLALIGPAEAVTNAGPITFSWHSLPRAERYTVEVLTTGGQPVVARTTPDTTVTVTLPSNPNVGDYTWWVVAIAGDGSETRSATRALRLLGR